MDIKLDEELPTDINLLIRMKAYEFKEEGVKSISVNDIKDYLYEVKWKHNKELAMCDVIDDILSLNFSTLFDYLEVKVIKEASSLKIDDFEELISK